MISVVSKNNLLCYVVDTSKFEHINEMKQILVGFAEKIDIINMNNIPMQHTIELMKNKNQLQQKVVEFIKNIIRRLIKLNIAKRTASQPPSTSHIHHLPHHNLLRASNNIIHLPHPQHLILSF